MQYTAVIRCKRKELSLQFTSRHGVLFLKSIDDIIAFKSDRSSVQSIGRRSEFGAASAGVSFSGHLDRFKTVTWQ